MLPDNFEQLKALLDEKVATYNTPAFIADDPISIPHRFTLQQDIEIMGLFAAVFAWGQRKTIINKCNELIDLFGGTPYDFILNHSDADLKGLLQFKHRTFNATDLLYFVEFLNYYYRKHDSLEGAFTIRVNPLDKHMGVGLTGFHNLFFSLEDAPERTRKHIATPVRGSTCKRLNMYLRWMVRNDDKGVDFGLWKSIKPSQLLCPLDLHVDRVARRLGLIQSTQTNWKTVLELTDNLRRLDPEDPVKYDFALFGMGVIESVK